jgi:hypothetical protein
MQSDHLVDPLPVIPDVDQPQPRQLPIARAEFHLKKGVQRAIFFILFVAQVLHVIGTMVELPDHLTSESKNLSFKLHLLCTILDVNIHAELLRL